MTQAISNLAPPTTSKHVPFKDIAVAQEAALLRPVLHALMLHALMLHAQRGTSPPRSPPAHSASLEAEIQQAAEADLTIGEFLERQATRRSMRSFEDSACVAASSALKALHVGGPAARLAAAAAAAAAAVGVGVLGRGEPMLHDET
jgi:hypothetical protein